MDDVTQRIDLKQSEWLALWQTATATWDIDVDHAIVIPASRGRESIRVNMAPERWPVNYLTILLDTWLVPGKIRGGYLHIDGLGDLLVISQCDPPT